MKRQEIPRPKQGNGSCCNLETVESPPWLQTAELPARFVLARLSPNFDFYRLTQFNKILTGSEIADDLDLNLNNRPSKFLKINFYHGPAQSLSIRIYA